MNISEVIAGMKAGRFYARPGWGERVYIYLSGEVIMLARNGFDSPWQAPHPDIMADNWADVIPTK